MKLAPAIILLASTAAGAQTLRRARQAGYSSAQAWARTKRDFRDAILRYQAVQ